MTQMMTTTVKLPPIIGPIMIPIFVDLGLDIGDSNNRFPGVYLQVFTNTQLSNLVNQNHSFSWQWKQWIQIHKFQKKLFSQAWKMFMQRWYQIFGSLIFTYRKVQVPLLGMKFGGIGPLKLLYCMNLFPL